MFRNNSNYIYRSQTSEIENNNINDIAEESESAVVIVKKQKINRRLGTSYSISKSLSNKIILASLIMLSTLDNVAGHKKEEEDFLFALCSLKASLCNFIRLNDKGDRYVREILRSAFDKSVTYIKKYIFSFSIPLSLPSMIDYEDIAGDDIFNKLWIMSSFINNKYTSIRRKKLGIGICQSEKGFCGNSVSKFCRNNLYFDFNTTIVYNCCSSIGSYLVHTESKLNLSSETLLNNLNIVESNNITDPIVSATNNEDFTSVISMSILFLFIVITLFSFCRYKYCSRRKEHQRGTYVNI
ncbi:hypothetical protein [Candidatus Ichthyocystis sparus]|uniref:hypothetical protein n=1 Tax=Candidatus Ichthyocystis sparus TaxID=1561004 RepID=UPI000B89535B|nr:hypothetical protein [Candidatus Ichthyocystis sparus]